MKIHARHIAGTNMNGFKRALEIIEKNYIHMPKEFARLMWPDSPCWDHYCRCGYGVHRGGGMYLAAGGLLGKLRTKGLIRTPWHDDWKSYYCLTDEGREYLRNESI